MLTIVGLPAVVTCAALSGAMSDAAARLDSVASVVWTAPSGCTLFRATTLGLLDVTACTLLSGASGADTLTNVGLLLVVGCVAPEGCTVPRAATLGLLAAVT